ncbi:MAG TPA: viral replication protein [Candidatus Evtepia faecigallinarum]|nr:viral replication protein [Candidatus Evtepia faecigallinarum]
MGNNAQSRKWSLVINHPLDAGLSHEVIREILHRFSPQYFCLADEVSATGTYHTHVFFFSASPARFSTIKNRFPTAHIEKAYGTVQENRAYLRKEGRWAETEKAATVVPGTFEEWGTPPQEREEKHPEMFRLMQNILAGMSTAEILTENPGLAFRVREIDQLRQTLLSDRYAVENRALEVTYLYGASGVGKTRGIYARHDPRQICRITNYRGGKGVSFDAYHQQDVLVFEEFHSQIPIAEMLNYLDIYPLALPARYSDRVACYTKVYLTSNLPLQAQYPQVQKSSPETWRAFLRRIHHVVEYRRDGSTTLHEKGEISHDPN